MPMTLWRRHSNRQVFSALRGFEQAQPLSPVAWSVSMIEQVRADRDPDTARQHD